ncbi:hypothetical protein M3M39_06875 [Fructilactobacillus hinvesii]|uniref:Uncharacterized protein n=1 Tax=Fructilactobacillus hinvesii TaxID=2940300 RepID=A0ABY5BRT1_9LACO|nr:hypothetical protein [Fructilactobacillus hinvesii]USS87817.1 hypothetical protein M3M39_06875 [Fructilactobacillus hinvesii]
MKRKAWPWYWRLFLFISSALLPQIVLYFTSINFIPERNSLLKIQNELNLSNYQFIFVQVLELAVWVTFIFGVTYLISWSLLKLFTKQAHSMDLFMAMIFEFLMTASLSLVVVVLFKVVFPPLSAIIAVVVLMISYNSFTKHQDGRGTLIIGFVAILLNIIQLFFIY